MPTGDDITQNPPPIEWGATYDGVVEAAALGYALSIDQLNDVLDDANTIADIDAGQLWSPDRVSADMAETLTEPVAEAARTAVEHYSPLVDDVWDHDAVVDRIAGGLTNRTRWVGNDAWRAISRSVGTATNEGWTLDRLARTIRGDVLEPAGYRIPKARVDTARSWAQRKNGKTHYRDGGLWVQRIAQTELGRVTSLSQLETAIAADLKWKRWEAVNDGATRVSHGPEGAHMQIRYLRENFTVGVGELDMPRGNGPASEVIGCRCIATYDVTQAEADEAGRP